MNETLPIVAAVVAAATFAHGTSPEPAGTEKKAAADYTDHTDMKKAAADEGVNGTDSSAACVLRHVIKQ